MYKSLTAEDAKLIRLKFAILLTISDVLWEKIKIMHVTSRYKKLGTGILFTLAKISFTRLRRTELTNRCVKLRRQVFLNFSTEPCDNRLWMASFSQIHNHFHTLCRLSGSNMCKLFYRYVTLSTLQYCVYHACGCELYF